MIDEVTIERVMLRVATRWTTQDLEAFRRNARQAYSEARVCLRAARHATTPARALDWLCAAEVHRHYARRERVRARACAAWVNGASEKEHNEAWAAFKRVQGEFLRRTS